VRYFERSNEKSLLRKFMAIKRNCKSIAAIDVTSNHTAKMSMPECPIPVLIRLENIFYEINVKLKLKTKIQEGHRSTYIQTHLEKKCLCHDKYCVESRAKCNVNKMLQSTVAHTVKFKCSVTLVF